jgi:hypothetical protein
LRPNRHSIAGAQVPTVASAASICAIAATARSEGLAWVVDSLGVASLRPQS